MLNSRHQFVVNKLVGCVTDNLYQSSVLFVMGSRIDT